MCQLLLNDVIVGRLQGVTTVCGCYGVLRGLVFCSGVAGNI